MFSNITRGGQLQIHQLRMMQQIFCFAFIISFAISFAIFCRCVSQDINLLQVKHSYAFVEAKIYHSLSAVINKKETNLINHIEKQAAERTITIIQKRAQQSSVYFLIIFPTIFGMWFLYGRRQKKTDIIKGKKLLSTKELKKLIAPSDLKIGDLPLVKNRELQHILVTGTTGAGKSTLFNTLLPQIRKRPNKAIVVDVTGEYIAKFYRPETDFIFNPLDERSVNWDIWADCHLESHYETFAASIIPNKKHQTDDIWDASSRAVIVEVMRKLAATKNPSISKLLSIISKSSISDLEHFLKGTNAAKIITTAADKTTLSVLMNLTTQIASLKLMQDVDANFSIRKWVADESNSQSWLFISSRADQIDVLRPLISTMTDMALNALLSLDPNKERRLWFIIDEVAKMNKLPSLASALAESRKYGGCIMIGIQSIAQLTENYGYALAQGIVDMFNSFIFFRSHHPQTTEWIAKVLGTVEQEELHEQMSYGANIMRDGVSFSKQTKSKSLVLPSEIANLPDLEAYVKYSGYDVTKIKLDFPQLPDNHPGFVIRGH